MTAVRVGDVLLYRLAQGDVEWIRHQAWDLTYPHQLGDVLPLLVCRLQRGGPDLPPLVDGQVFLWGPGILWVTHRNTGTEPGTWSSLEVLETEIEG